MTCHRIAGNAWYKRSVVGQVTKCVLSHAFCILKPLAVPGGDDAELKNGVLHDLFVYSTMYSGKRIIAAGRNKHWCSTNSALSVLKIMLAPARSGECGLWALWFAVDSALSFLQAAGRKNLRIPRTEAYRTATG